jgi:hypothetical protein
MLTNCPLTGYILQGQGANFHPTFGDYVDYTFRPVGRVKISLPELHELEGTHQALRSVLAGICRNRFDSKEDTLFITRNFVENELRTIPYPKDFKSKSKHLIKYLYDMGGKENKSFNLTPGYDYPICYADNHEEFTRIVDFCESNYWIRWGNRIAVSGGRADYRAVQLTSAGIKEAEKELPQIPMIGLVNQSISTGELSTDQKINHARELFFQEPQTLDRMRSACEALSFVLEPLREDLIQFFQKKDVSDFFNIVNNFDIRHNKEQTKEIQHPEQLEWVYYSLLNTINTYTKLKNKNGA